MRYRFGRYELDEEAGELRREGKAVSLQPKPFDLLRLLLRERSRVVPSDEIFDVLWPGVAVTPSSLTRAVSLARRAIGDTHKGETIRSVARRGYRFCADVVEIDAVRRSESQAPEPQGPEARGTRRAEQGPEPVAAGGDPFLGRQEALGILSEAWHAAATCEGGIALVRGPAGIGKSRLAERFAGQVERSGGLVLTGRSREGEGVPAFWLWAQVLRRLVERGAEPDELAPLSRAGAELAELVPGLAERAPGESAGAPATGVAPEQSRFLLFDAVTQSLLRTSRRRPLLILLEDLQWAGSASLRLLEHLAYEMAHAPILVLATLREEAFPPDHPLVRALPALRQQPRCTELALRGFSRREVAALLEQRLGRPPPPDLTTELFARTEGVPLFLREAIRLLAERGDLQHPERVRRWAVTLPAQALDLIRRPLERLSPPCAELVGAAAVLGREFQLSVASAVAELPRETAVDLLDEGERAGIVRAAEDLPGTWRFVHALFQEAAYEALAAGRRAKLHARAAAELERRHADDLDRVIAELAHHHHEALAVGDPERAFACACRAATRATRLLAYEQAAIHHGQAVAALDHLEAADPARRLASLLDLGEAHRLAGERERRRAVFAEAMEAARVLQRPVEAARAAIGFCDLSEWAPKDLEAWLRVTDALAGLPPEAESERARLLTRLAYLSMREAPEEAEPRAREAVALARRAGDPDAMQDALYALFFRLAGPDHLEEREKLAREALATVQASHLGDPSLIAFLDMACDRLAVGDREGSRHWRHVAGQVAGSLPHLGRLWHLRVFDAGEALLEGRFGDAERCMEEAARLGLRIAHPYARGVDRAMRAWLARERGDTAEVLRIFDPAHPVRLGPVQWVQALTARALWAEGRQREARALFEELLAEGAAAIPRNIRWHDTICEIALLCADVGDAERAGELLALLEPVAHHHGVLPLPIYYGGPFTRCLARLREARGELAEAEALYEEALECVEALGARPMAARLLLERGRLGLRRGERRSAREHLAAARAQAAELGMAAVQHAAEEAAQTLQEP